MNINKISNKLIKPQTPTPPHLKKYQVSFLDLCVGTTNVAVILYYKSKPGNDIDNQLEESLAKILVQFYPLAGRYIKNDFMVDCSDQGAEFVTAEAPDLELIDLVGKIKVDQLEALVPDQHFRVDKDSEDPILSLQSQISGVAGPPLPSPFLTASIGTFVAAWSAANNPCNTVEFTTPSFDLPSLLPAKKDHYYGTAPPSSSTNQRMVDFRRLLFNEAAMTNLKSKIRPKGKTVSGVRVVTAVITEALIRLDRARHRQARDFVVIQPVNLRERTVPPQPKHACGNFFIPSTGRYVAVAEGEDIGVEGLVDLIGSAVRRLIVDHVDILRPEKDGRGTIVNSLRNLTMEMLKPETSVAVFTDWSKFGFYEADFGWGMPVWTSPGPQRPPINTILLMGNEEGNWIEAWVCLDENEVRCFEEDEVIKSFLT